MGTLHLVTTSFICLLYMVERRDLGEGTRMSWVFRWVLWGSALDLMAESSSSTAVPLTLRVDEWDASGAKGIQPWEAIKSPERELQPELDSPGTRLQLPGGLQQQQACKGQEQWWTSLSHHSCLLPLLPQQKISVGLIEFCCISSVLNFCSFFFFLEKLESVRTMKRKTSEPMANVMVPDNVLYVIQCGKIPCEHSAVWELGCTRVTLSPLVWSLYTFPHHWLVNNSRDRRD